MSKLLYKVGHYYEVKYGFNSSNIYKISVPIDFIEHSPIYEELYGKTNEAEFKDFFSKTKHKYRIIFTSTNSGTFDLIDADVDVVKSNIKQKIKELEQVKNDEKNKTKYEESKFLLGKIYEWLDKDSINIIANFLHKDDKTPQSLAHDIFHSSIEHDIEEEIYKKSKIPISELEKDYTIYRIYNNSDELREVSWSNFYNKNTKILIKKMIESSIFFNDKRKNFISYKNFLEQSVFDMAADLLPLYFEQENTFNNVDIKGAEFNFTTDYVVKPKNENGDLPHVEKYIREILKEIRKIIEQKLDGLVGKVFSLY